jgi:hypothetical protein
VCHYTHNCVRYINFTNWTITKQSTFTDAQYISEMTVTMTVILENEMSMLHVVDTTCYRKDKIHDSTEYYMKKLVFEMAIRIGILFS